MTAVECPPGLTRSPSDPTVGCTVKKRISRYSRSLLGLRIAFGPRRSVRGIHDGRSKLLMPYLLI